MVACTQPHPIVICHNANCGEPTDPENDDTLPAFRESLTLQESGRPAIDGIELDSFLIYKIVSDAAVAANRDVEVEFQSFSPELLRAVIDNKPASTLTPYSFGAVQGVPSPLDDQTRELRDYTGLPITDVQFHPLFVQAAQHEAVLRSGAGLSFFWFNTTPEVFAAIRRFQPFAVDTSEARLMRRWLER